MATPVATDDLLYTIDEDDRLMVNPASGVLNNDTDADGDALASHVNATPENPLFNMKTNGTFIYDARYHGPLWVDGSDTLEPDDGGDPELPDGFNSLAEGAVVYEEFTYDASDGQDTDTATVRVAIVGVNDEPEAFDDALILAEATSDTVDVLSNDTDVDVWPTPDTLEIVALTDLADDGGPAGGSDTDPLDGLTITTDKGGTVELVGGQLEYTAAADFFGIDTVEYEISDGNGGTATAELRVTVTPVNEAPDAVDDSYTVSEDAGATNFSTVLVNDTDTDDAPLIAAELVDPIATALSGPVDGSDNPIPGVTDPGVLVDFNSDGTFNYDPNGNVAGAFDALNVGDSAFVTFDYIGYDGSNADDEATVTIEIQGENDAPDGTDPEAVKVYEAGLADGSGDGPTTIMQTINVTATDPDNGATLILGGDNTGSQTTLIGTYGILAFNNDLSATYTLQSNAAHLAEQGHNEEIFDNFVAYVVDEHGASDAVNISVEVVDDINFLVELPNGGGTGDDLDNTSVAYVDGADVSDTFTHIKGADDASIDIVGIPNDTMLADGSTVVSSVFIDGSGNEAVRGVISGGMNDGETFYELTIDPQSSTDVGEYTLDVFQDLPVIENPLDFSSVEAGGPHETLVVENIEFSAGFFTIGMPSNPEDMFNNFIDSAGSDDDVNPNSAGGAGVGNGNIDEGETLVIDVTGSASTVSAIKLVVQGVGGGIDGSADLNWVAVESGSIVASGFVDPTNINVKGGEELLIDPGVSFDQLYVGLDPNDVDGNDKARINNITTIEEVLSDDIVLGFRALSDEGDPDGDQSPLPTEDPAYEEWTVTVEGNSGMTTDEGIQMA